MMIVAKNQSELVNGWHLFARLHIYPTYLWSLDTSLLLTLM